MSDLKINEQIILEDFFEMSQGYLLDHTNDSLARLVNQSAGISLYSDKYFVTSNSKANRMRAIWQLEPNQLVAKLIRDIIEDYVSSRSNTANINKELMNQCLGIASRLENNPRPSAHGVFTPVPPPSPQYQPMQQAVASAFTPVPPPSPQYQPMQQAVASAFSPPPPNPFIPKKQLTVPPAPTPYIPESQLAVPPSPTNTPNNQPAVQPPEINAVIKNKVFIVHGHDDLAKEQLARFITSVGLEPIILHEQVSGSNTIIEKFLKYAKEVCFAVVIYSPCDVGSKKGAEILSPRARQNVVFEHGFFIAKLGRENVTAIVKGDVEKPNDISGVVYETFDEGGAWKFKLAREMKFAGCDIDMNKIT